MTPASSALVQRRLVTRTTADEGTLSDLGHSGNDNQLTTVEVGLPGGSHRRADTQVHHAAANSVPPTDPTLSTSPKVVPGSWEDALLLVYSDTLDDLEGLRIATENRVRSIRQLRSVGAGTETEERLDSLCEAIRTMEHGIILELKRALRKHPLGAWVKRTVGVGEKQGARLLAAIGDPADRQHVSQLISYCGYAVRDGQAPTRKRGEYGGWNPTARMRAYLVAEACMKQRTSPYRAVYDAGREKYADAFHAHPCKRCGPSGKPAAAGSPLSDGHKHARALRLVAKAVLKDLWREARELRSSIPGRPPFLARRAHPRHDHRSAFAQGFNVTHGHPGERTFWGARVHRLFPSSEQRIVGMRPGHPTTEGERMSRILTIHLHHDPSDHWLHATVGASVYEDRCYVDTHTTRLAVLDLGEASCEDIGKAVELCRSLSQTLDCPLIDMEGEPWTDEGLDALAKAVVG